MDGNPRGRANAAIALHRGRRPARGGGRRGNDHRGHVRPRSPTTSAKSPFVQDNGDLVLPANTYDLHGIGLRFTRSGGGYSLARRSTATSGDARQPRHTRRRRQHAREDSVLLSVLRRRPEHRLRQLRRQHHPRRGGQVEQRTRRLAMLAGAAAHRAVLRRSRSDRRAARFSSTPRRTSTRSPAAPSPASTRPARRRFRRRCCPTAASR